MLSLELRGKVVAQTSIEIFTTQVRVPCRCLDFKDAFFDGQQRHIKSTASQIKNQHVLLRRGRVLLVQTVRDRSRGRFVDNSQAVQAGNDRRILGRLSLGVVKVRRHGHDGVLHVSPQKRLGDFSHLHQNHGRNLLRRERLLLPVKLNFNHRFLRFPFHDRVRKLLHVVLHLRIGKLSPD